MSAAYVLMNIEAGKVGRALTGLKGIKGVKTVHAVAGPYDIIAFIEADTLEKLGERVLIQVHNLSGVSEMTGSRTRSGRVILSRCAHPNLSGKGWDGGQDRFSCSMARWISRA